MLVLICIFLVGGFFAWNCFLVSVGTTYVECLVGASSWPPLIHSISAEHDVQRQPLLGPPESPPSSRQLAHLPRPPRRTNLLEAYLAAIIPRVRALPRRASPRGVHGAS
uniref:Secreted protein n=1 Tax=Steinernema glaseri TaxID=37863 RepID=A0A1I7Z7G9_9BILA